MTRKRIWLAYALAATADIVQLALGPLGWTFADEIGDVIVMGLLSATIGFHPLLLPTFVLELFPIVDLLPTWTGCVALVIAIRRRQQVNEPPPPGGGPVIDV